MTICSYCQFCVARMVRSLSLIICTLKVLIAHVKLWCSVYFHLFAPEQLLAHSYKTMYSGYWNWLVKAGSSKDNHWNFKKCLGTQTNDAEDQIFLEKKDGTWTFKQILRQGSLAQGGYHSCTSLFNEPPASALISFLGSGYFERSNVIYYTLHLFFVEMTLGSGSWI